MKRCYACKRELPLDAFGKNRGKPDGLSDECRECKRKSDATSHLRNRESRLAKMRVYRSTNLVQLQAAEREYARSARGRTTNKSAGARYRQRHAEAITDRNLRRAYGLTLQQRKAMYTAQAGRCKLCDRPVSYAKTDTDHNHATGEVRGLLCHRCNHLIGMLETSADLLIAALRYASLGHIAGG